MPHDLGLNAHCAQNSICILKWTLGPSGDTPAGPPRSLSELGLRPLVADCTAFHLALENAACFASASCKPSPGHGRGKPWARRSAAVQSLEERLEIPKQLFPDTTLKDPLFLPSLPSTPVSFKLYSLKGSSACCPQSTSRSYPL